MFWWGKWKKISLFPLFFYFLLFFHLEKKKFCGRSKKVCFGGESEKYFSLFPLFFHFLYKKKFPHQKCFLLPLPKNYHYFLWEKWIEIFFFHFSHYFLLPPTKIFFWSIHFPHQKKFFLLTLPKNYYFLVGEVKKRFFFKSHT